MKFVSLHNHTGMSLYDGLGSPEDLSEWMLKNAGDEAGALAITDHGSMNAIGPTVETQNKYKKAGVPVKFIYGIEAYYVPSLESWRIEKDKMLELKKEQKKKKQKDPEGLVVEDGDEAKNAKRFNPVKRRNHLVLCAYNQKGLENLYRLTSRSYKEGMYFKPRMDFQMLKAHNEGLIASTACILGIPGWAILHPDATPNTLKIELEPLMDLFGKDRFFLELQFNKLEQQRIINKRLIEFSKETGYKLIVTADTHYPSPDMFRDREIYKLLGYQMNKHDVDMSILEKTRDDLECELYLKNGDQIFEAYKQTFEKECQDENLIIEAIERTYSIAHDFIGNVSPDDTTKLPKTFQVTETIKTPFDKLKSIVLQGLKEKNLTSKEYIDRAVRELGVIKRLGHEEYFLTEMEIMKALKAKMLCGPGRGSGAGSLINYLCGITLVDPIRFNLLFERFLSESRKGFPDIDSDIERKEDALEILKERFGDDNVLSITNYNRFQLKSLVKDIARLYGVGYVEVNNITKAIEGEAKSYILKEVNNDQKLYELTYERAKKYSPTFVHFLKKYPKIGTHIENLYQEVKSSGTHAGGVLIVPDAEGQLPIVRIKGVNQSPVVEGLTAQHLKYFGLIKFDVLGLSTLKIIRGCIENVLRDEQGLENPTISDVWDFYNQHLHPDVINFADKKVLKKVYHKGKFPSIFQFTETGVQHFCKKAKPKSIIDISNISALWRPGALSAHGDKRYLAFDQKEFERKEHPIIQEVLGPTRGVLIFQEQFMQLANKLAGFTLEEADNLRKLLVKPVTSLAAEIRKEREDAGKKFIAGCIEKGLSEERATNLWSKEILSFVSYGFNSGHSTSYAINSYHCAWLYTYHESSWIKACLENDPNLERTISVVRSLGYKIKNPDINDSPINTWSVTEGKVCTPPLVSLKGVGVTAATELIKQRPEGGFSDIYDFLYNKDGVWRWSKLNKKTLQTLARVDAFSCLNCIGSDKLFKNTRHFEESIFKNWTKRKKRLDLEQIASTVPDDDWNLVERMMMQKEIIGFFDKKLLIEEYQDMLKEFKIKAIDEVPDNKSKNKIWAVVEKVSEKKTKNGDPYLIVLTSGLSDLNYSFKVWNTSKSETKDWKPGQVLVFSLSYNKDFGYNIPRNGNVVRLCR